MCIFFSVILFFFWVYLCGCVYNYDLLVSYIVFIYILNVILDYSDVFVIICEVYVFFCGIWVKIFFFLWMVLFFIVFWFLWCLVWFFGNCYIWVVVMILWLGGFGVFDWWYLFFYMVLCGWFVVGFGYSLIK